MKTVSAIVKDIRVMNVTRIDTAGDSGPIRYSIKITCLEGENVLLLFETRETRDECIERLAKQFSALAA